MSDLANIDISDNGDGVLVARVRGDLDLSNLHAIHAALMDAVPNDAFGLVVDPSKHVVGQRNHHLGHDNSIAGGNTGLRDRDQRAPLPDGVRASTRSSIKAL